MSKTIKYTGTQRRWPELAYTGKQSVWYPGQMEERSDFEADLLLRSGQFEVHGRVLTNQELAYINSGQYSQRAVLSGEVLPGMLYGDSRGVAGSNGINASQFDLRVMGAVTPAGGASGGNWLYRAAGIQNVYSAAQVVANCAISGQTLQDMLDREDDAASATRKSIEDGVSVGARWAIFFGGINSITSLVTLASGYVQATTDTIISQREDIMRRMVARGLDVFDMGEAGYDYAGDPTNFPQSRIDAIRQTIREVNAAAARFAAASNGRVEYVPVYQDVCDADGNWLSGMCEDVITAPTTGQRVHQSVKAAQLYWKRLRAVFERRYGICVPTYRRFLTGLSGATNQLPNADMVLSSSGLATGFTHSGNGSSPVRTPSLVTIDGQLWQALRCTFGASNASNYAQLNLPMPIVSGGAVVVAQNEEWFFSCEAMIDDGAGGPPPELYLLQVPPGRVRLYLGGTTNNLFYDACSIQNGVQMPQDGPMRFRLYWRIKMPEASANINALSSWAVGFGNQAGSTFRILVAAGAQLLRLV